MIVIVELLPRRGLPVVLLLLFQQRARIRQRPRRLTPEQALARTKELLEQKLAHDREVQPWQLLDPQHGHVAEPGYQSNEAADKAMELHAGESRMKAIQGSIGTQDRHNQGKRDNR